MKKKTAQYPEITIALIRQALRLDDYDCVPAQLRMAPEPRGISADEAETPPRQAGVLTLVYPDVDGLHIVLTRRQAHLRGHSGQISFPGGRRDPEDDTFIATALRETEEELGIMRDDITVIGELSSIYIPPSHYEVHPVVGFLDNTPFFRPSEDEVAEVFSFRVVDLLDESLKHHEYRDFRGVRVKIPYYKVHGHKVWGATAIMLSEFEHRLQTVVTL